MTEEEKVQSVVARYVEGMARGDADMLAGAMHSRVSVIGHFDGALEWSSLAEFTAACEDEAISVDAPVPPFEIETLDIDGDCALVRVTNVWAGIRFRDWLTLLHLDGRWLIVGKLFRVID